MTRINVLAIQRSSALCCHSHFSSVQKHYELFISSVEPFGFVTVVVLETDPLYFLNLRCFGYVRCRRLQILYLFHLSFIPHLLMSLFLLLSLLILFFPTTNICIFLLNVVTLFSVIYPSIKVITAAATTSSYTTKCLHLNENIYKLVLNMED